MKDSFKLNILLLLVLLVTISSVAKAEVDQYGNLQLKNDYISVIINQNQFNKGRFAIDVTGGAPMRSGDDGKPLVYGHPFPWSSYTTIRIDKKNYIFGGKTDKRAGRKGKYGELVQAPQIKENSIVTKYKFDNIVVSQILNFVKSSTTGLPDTVQIRYRITNQGDKPHQVGTRVMIDTMLGKNDGAPFRSKNKALTGDTLFLQDKMPAFWQAFDTLSNPKVTAQGTVKGAGLTTPDEMYFADWGSLADDPWEFDFNQEEEFMRKGEFELDSAMALFWQPTTLQPGETRSYVTNYGLGGITIVPGLLSLGVTSPAEVIMDQPNKKAQIVAYIQNTAEITVKDVKVDLDLPQGLELISDSKVQKLGNLKPGATAQVMWKVRPKKALQQRLDYTVKVSAKNTDDNQVTRGLKVIGPPKLSLQLMAPNKISSKDNKLEKDNFILQAKITNYGASTAYGIDTYLALPPGLSLSPGDKENKFLGYLRPGQSITVPWYLKPIGIIDGKLPYSLEVTSNNVANKIESGSIVVSKLNSEVEIEVLSQEDEYRVGDYLTAQIKLNNLPQFYRSQANIHYNNKVLEPIYISRGNLFIEDGELLSWNSPQIDDEQGLIKGISGALDTAQDINSGVIANIHFKVKSVGKINLGFDNFNAYDNQERKIKVKLKDNQLSIGEDRDEK